MLAMNCDLARLALWLSKASVSARWAWPFSSSREAFSASFEVSRSNCARIKLRSASWRFMFWKFRRVNRPPNVSSINKAPTPKASTSCNTAPAILLGVLNVLKNEQDAILCVFPADHVIDDVARFHTNLESAIGLAENNYIVTFGIKPHYPETGYGYIEGHRKIAAGALKIKRFVEKPNRKTAKDYLAAGNYFWNSGMFTFKASVILDEFKHYQPDMLQSMEKMVLQNDQMSGQSYGALPNISIDYAIMEKTAKGVVLPAEFGWSDIGSWKSLYEFLPKGDYNNVIDGDVIARNTENCFILGRDRLIATNCIKNLVIIETPDSVFVSDLDNSRDVKTIVENLQAGGRREYKQHTTVYHSWGNTTLLEQHPDYTVNRMNIYPGEIAELNPKEAKTRYLTVISGTGRIAAPQQKSRLIKGQTFLLTAGEAAKIENSGKLPLCFIEIEMAE